MRKAKFLGNVQAALINLKLIEEEKPRVYNLIDFNAYLLLQSTILDTRAATYLVNSSDLLVLGTFYPTNSTNTVEAGTQAFLVTG